MACQCCTTAFPALCSHPKKAAAVTPSSRIAMMTYDPPATLSAASMHGLNCSISVLSLSLTTFSFVIRALGLTLLSKHLPLICSPLTCQSYQTTFQTTPVRPPATLPASAARRGKNLPGRSPASSRLPLSPPTPPQVFVLLTTKQCLLHLRALPLVSALSTCRAWDHVGLPSATGDQVLQPARGPQQPDVLQDWPAAEM